MIGIVFIYFGEFFSPAYEVMGLHLCAVIKETKGLTLEEAATVYDSSPLDEERGADWKAALKRLSWGRHRPDSDGFKEDEKKYNEDLPLDETGLAPTRTRIRGHSLNRKGSPPPPSVKKRTLFDFYSTRTEVNEQEDGRDRTRPGRQATDLPRIVVDQQQDDTAVVEEDRRARRHAGTSDDGVRRIRRSQQRPWVREDGVVVNPKVGGSEDTLEGEMDIVEVPRKFNES